MVGVVDMVECVSSSLPSKAFSTLYQSLVCLVHSGLYHISGKFLNAALSNIQTLPIFTLYLPELYCPGHNNWLDFQEELVSVVFNSKDPGIEYQGYRYQSIQPILLPKVGRVSYFLHHLHTSAVSVC